MKDEMALPDGYTCKDCFAFRRHCEPLGISKPDRETCDWLPVRFQLSASALKELKELRAKSSIQPI